jgi:E3 ubiquitin-protein ligase Mdm2
MDSDTETIYSEQGYETIKAAEGEEEEDDASSTDMEEGDTTREVFDVEYDIDSGEEEERPPQAHGQGRDFSSADDTDTDIDEDHRAPSAVAVAVESVYWADSEEEKGEVDEVDLEISKNVWKCISCQTPNELLFPYCSRCWEIKKSWAPERPRNKRKGKKAIAKAVKTPVVLPDSGTDDTDGAPSTEMDRPRSETMSSQDSGIGSQDMEMMELTETELVVDHKPSLDLTKFNRSLSLDSRSEKSSSSSVANTIDVSDLSELGSASDLRARTADPDLCMFCDIRPKNATFIHGRLGHQVCCYPCAKKCWKKQPTCPVCKRTVERIVKIIQA